jgi:predicted DNA-binding protein (MmcQ/YjbR family)
MNIDWLRQFCLSLPYTTEQLRWTDRLVFKVGGKLYAVASLEPGPHELALKCSEEAFVELVERPGIIPAPYLARAHWIALESEDALSRGEIEQLLVRAHALVFAKLPKKVQAALTRRHPARRRSRSAVDPRLSS